MTNSLTKTFHLSDVLSLSTGRAMGSPKTLTVPNGGGIRQGAVMLGMVGLCEHLSGVKLFNSHNQYDARMLSAVKAGTTEVLLLQHEWLKEAKFPNVQMPDNDNARREICDKFIELVQVIYCPEGWVDVQGYQSQVAEVVNPIRGNQLHSHLHLVK